MEKHKFIITFYSVNEDKRWNRPVIFESAPNTDYFTLWAMTIIEANKFYNKTFECIDQITFVY